MGSLANWETDQESD